MTTPVITPDTIATTLAQLTRDLAALGDPGDVLLTYNAQARFAREQSWLQGRISTLRASVRTLAEVEPQIATLTTWRDHLIEWRRILSEELAALPVSNAPPLFARYQALTWSLQRIDRGLDFMNELLPANLPLDDLMRASGYIPRDLVARAHGECWLGTLPQTEHRLTALIARRDDAQTRLEQVIAEVDARQAMARAL
jgi:hypothetical protein